MRRAPSDSGRMQRGSDDTTDETFLLLNYEQKQRFERWAAKLHARSYSDLYSLAIYGLTLERGVVSQWVVLYSADI